MLAFKVFDRDGSGEINFEEFILTMWNVCTLDEGGLLTFVFNLYDQDGGGTLDAEEVEFMLKAVSVTSGDSDFSPEEEVMVNANVIRQIQKWTTRLNYDDNGEVNPAGFALFSDRYPELMKPAQELRWALRERGGGDDFWEGVAKRRAGVIDGAKKMTESSYKAESDEVGDIQKVASTITRSRAQKKKDTDAKVGNAFISFDQKANKDIMAEKLKGKKGMKGNGANETAAAELRVRAMRQSQHAKRAIDKQWTADDAAREQAHEDDPLFALMKCTDPTAFTENDATQKKNREESFLDEKIKYIKHNAAEINIGTGGRQGGKAAGAVAVDTGESTGGISSRARMAAEAGAPSSLRRRRLKSKGGSPVHDVLAPEDIVRAKSARLRVDTFSARTADKELSRRDRSRAQSQGATPKSAGAQSPDTGATPKVPGREVMSAKSRIGGRGSPPPPRIKRASSRRHASPLRLSSSPGTPGTPGTPGIFPPSSSPPRSSSPKS